MSRFEFVDIHCHLLPGIDDGSSSLEESMAMAEIAVADGISSIITTPHQLGNFSCNRGDDIRKRVSDLQSELDRCRIPLTVLAGGDVRIEPGMIDGIKSGDILTLADKRKHVLLELPHELYFPLGPVLAELKSLGMQGILSHPERNHGIRAQPRLVSELVNAGCLMQVTAGSLVGTFGPAAKALAESMVKAGHVHFISTDAHHANSRRPLMRRSFDRAVEMVGRDTAIKMCCDNPALVAAGQPVTAGTLSTRQKAGLSRWFKAAA